VLRIALGGAVGTALRLAVGGLALSMSPPGALRLLAINVLGALLLGRVAVRPPLPARWMPALATGLLGGFTTFSTMVVQSGTLGHEAGLGRVVLYLTASVTLGLAGYLLGRGSAGRP